MGQPDLFPTHIYCILYHHNDSVRELGSCQVTLITHIVTPFELKAHSQA